VVRLVSNQRPSACEAVQLTVKNYLHWSERCLPAELDPSEHLFREFGRILAGWNWGYLLPAVRCQSAKR
jgi:hypothetical protein